MPNPVFPNADLQDSKFFSMTPEDPAIRADIEGGYEVTRPRFTRTPRRTWTSGISFATNTVKQAVEAFWDTVKGGSVVFDWVNPENLVTYQVRFTKPITYQYVGIGGLSHWDIAFEIRQA